MLGILSTRAQAPVVNFTSDVTSGCGPLRVQFKDLSTNSATNWNWDFGNGQTSTAQNPAISFSAAGTYTVTLIARNKSGASAVRKTDYVTVFPYPTATMASNLTLACTPANVQFTDKSTPGQGTITTWLWNLGDGAISNEQNPSHVYTQTGYYTVTLKVTNSFGCATTANNGRYLRVVDGITPQFTWNQTSTGCTAPFAVSFLDQTAGPGNLTYNWNFGNGVIPAASSDTSPANINFPSTGNYTVTLQVTSDLGCSGSSQQVLPFSSNNAVLNGPDMACVNAPVSFSNGSAPAPAVNTWDFGDGSGSTDGSVTKTYNAIGTYAVKLVNKYPSCADSTTKTIQVVNPPTPQFSGGPSLVSCQAPLTVQFTDMTTPAATQWSWDFGDGTTSTDQNPSHTYTTTNNFDVKLTVTTAAGCSNTITKPQYVQIQAPTVTLTNGASLGACVTGTTGNMAVTTITPAISVKSLDGISGYSWSAPGATPSTSTLPNPVFRYASPGIYSISVTVTTTGGCPVSQTFSNVVRIGTPVVPTSLSIPTSTCGRDPVTFSDPETPTTDYLWHWFFDDGTDTLSEAPSVTHIYNTIGNKKVMLTLIHDGCPQTVSQTLTVNPPIAGFEFQPGCSPTPFYEVAFTDTSKTVPPPTFGPISWAWDFGDPSGVNNTSTLQNPQHSYPNTAPATYLVSLTVTNGACSNTTQVPITLAPTVAAFDPASFYCKNVDNTITSTSSNPSLISDYNWQLDGNAPQDGMLASFKVNIPDVNPHTVTLTITDTYGCTSTAAHPIAVTGPTAGFTLPSPAGGCLNAPIAFTDASTSYPANVPITSWNWQFGDQQILRSLTPNATHAYADTGFYIPRMIAIDANGCTDLFTITGKLQITSPQAFFIGPDSFYCPKTPLPFIDSSQGYGPFVYSWSFGDGSASADQSPAHSFATSGQTYPVSLTIKDIYGCTSSTSQSVLIQQPVAAFDIADTTAICTPLQTEFTAHGQFYDSLYWKFGDGATSTLPVTSHFYNTLGVFTAKLFVQGPGGCLDSASRKVLLSNPTAGNTFLYSPIQDCDSVPVQFSISPPGYTKFTVLFGDNAADSSGNTTPFHMYRNPSSYYPVMQLQDATGCIVNVSGQSGLVMVLGSVPFFSANPHTFCDDSTVVFTDFTETPNVSLLGQTMDFGDGAPIFTVPGRGSTWTHEYDKPGVFIPIMKVLTSGNCSENYTDTIRVYQSPHPVITLNSQACTGIIQFQGGLTDPQVDTINWSWDFANGQTSTDQNPSATFQPGNYAVTLRASVSIGCNDQTSYNLAVNPLPEIKGPREISTPVGVPVTIPFQYSPTITTFAWTPTDNLDCSTCPNPSANLIFSTQYMVMVTDNNNCSAFDTILVKTVCNDKNYFLPNTFSPNGDGNNDYFYPRGSNLYNIQSLRVFNRWGQMVFERKNFPANSASMGWDGNFNGRPAPSDAYVYIAEVVCDNAQVVALRGDVTLLR